MYLPIWRRDGNTYLSERYVHIEAPDECYYEWHIKYKTRKGKVVETVRGYISSIDRPEEYKRIKGCEVDIG